MRRLLAAAAALLSAFAVPAHAITGTNWVTDFGYRIDRQEVLDWIDTYRAREERQ